MSRIQRFLTRSVQRRVLTGFGIIIALILVGVIIFSIGFNRIQAISAQTAPTSEQLVVLQDYALSLSALSADVERLFAIGGQGIEENIAQDLDSLEIAANSIVTGSPEELAPMATSLAQASSQLKAETQKLVAMRTGDDVTSRDINEQTVAVFSALDSATQLQKDLTKGTLNHLGEAIDNQQRITLNMFAVTHFGAVVVLVIAIVASYLITRTIVKPLSEIAVSATQIAGGDYTKAVRVTTGDEVGQLGLAFNEMAQAVRSREADLQAQTDRLGQSIQELIVARRKAEEASRLKDEFLSVMSHELRTPLNAILGYQGIIELVGGLDADNLQMVQRTQANARRLLDLINDVLDISRIEAGRMEIVPTEVGVNDFVSRVQSQMEVLAQEKQLGFNIAVDSSMPATIFVDEDALTKVLVNLLGNAFKFTEAGHVDLSLRAENSQMIISVSDTGIGIPVYKHEIIFERFRQADSTSTRQHGGSGLGLSIVQQLCQLMGGKIAVESDTGQGSTFTVTLPLQPITLQVREIIR